MSSHSNEGLRYNVCYVLDHYSQHHSRFEVNVATFRLTRYRSAEVIMELTTVVLIRYSTP